MHDPAGPYMYGPGQRRMRRCLPKSVYRIVDNRNVFLALKLVGSPGQRYMMAS